MAPADLNHAIAAGMDAPFSEISFNCKLLIDLESSMVTTTIVNGRVLMRDRQLLTLDEGEITAKSRELAARIWERFEALR